MKTIIAGGRAYQLTNRDCLFLDEQAHELPITEVVTGRAKGADKGGEEWANGRHIKVTPFPADWDKHGKSAGPIRNGEMAKYADVLIAFPGGNGTADMIDQAVESGLKVLVVRDGEIAWSYGF